MSHRSYCTKNRITSSISLLKSARNHFRDGVINWFLNLLLIATKNSPKTCSLNVLFLYSSSLILAYWGTPLCLNSLSGSSILSKILQCPRIYLHTTQALPQTYTHNTQDFLTGMRSRLANQRISNHNEILLVFKYR